MTTFSRQPALCLLAPRLPTPCGATPADPYIMLAPVCGSFRWWTSDAYNGWVEPVAADRRAPSHPGQHSHIALLTAFVGRRPSLRADAQSAGNGSNQPKLIYSDTAMRGVTSGAISRYCLRQSALTPVHWNAERTTDERVGRPRHSTGTRPGWVAQAGSSRHSTRLYRR